MNKVSDSFKAYRLPAILGIAFSGLAFQWAFILDSWGRTFNRESLMALTFVWIIPLVISLVQKRRKSSAAWLAAPGLYVLVLALCRLSVSGQVEEARLRGQAIVIRAIQFSEATGAFPKTLAAISEFDGKPIPKTGVGIWSSEEREFYLGSSPGTSIAYDNYEKDPFFMESPYKTEFWVGFREYGFQEHKLRPEAEWDTESGRGDYLVGKVELRWW